MTGNPEGNPMSANPEEAGMLKACPFCGGTEVRILKPTCRPEKPYNPADRLYPVARCASPGCGGENTGKNEDYSGKSAAEAWNRRTLPHVGEGEAVSFQQRVQPWMMACFGPEIAGDRLERNDRFIEEALELVQANDYPRERVLALVDYVFGRPKGELPQEIGGVQVTLAALCLAHNQDMHECGEIELARIWTKVEKIRAKQATKPVGSALPIAHPPRTEIAGWPKEVPADVIAAVVGGGVTVDQVRNIYGLLRAAFNLREPKLPQDVVSLVIAAREIMDEDASPESRRNLDRAAEAFASRVPWEDAPLPAPPVSEEGR